ncbi:MAG: TRAP transporter small permease [Desulfovibrio sp.]|jgi:TRAP-type C4-dicarboxylate transport system permease small subunit|nr:TRAP transporter small permease [Desulfovibrio sp.]
MDKSSSIVTKQIHINGEKSGCIEPGSRVPMGHVHSQSVFSMEDTLFGILAEKLHNAASIITLPLMTLFICSEIILRYVLNSGLTWSQEACGLCLFILVLCCQANCWQKDRHIRMDLLYNNVPPWLRKITDVLTVISGMTFFGAIACQAVKDIPYQLAVNEATDEMHIPYWLLSAIVIISCALLFILLIWFILRLTMEKNSDGGRP